MKIEAQFTPALNDSSSPQFKALADNVGNSLLVELKKSLPVEAVQVERFKEGSVIAEYNMIFTDPEAENVNASSVQDAVHSAVKNGNFSGLSVNTTFLPAVEGTFAFPLTLI